MSELEEPHNQLVDDATLPGAGLARQALVAATFAPSAMLLVWLLLSFVGANGLAGLDLSATSFMRLADAPVEVAAQTWFDGAIRDITALGSNTVLIAVTLFTVALLAWTGRHGPALLLGWSAAASFLINTFLKLLTGRVRPDVLASSVVVETSSFPSGHAMHASVIYMLIAAIVVREIEDRRVATLILATAGALVMAVGLSRIYLGAHWTSDVLAGWAIGGALALGGWLMARSPRPPS
ncbi:MAG: phosphatase PAP2 family protein [Hyphomicrobiaceae bacterium]|nr:phosphatase PAP2 family protein [Hyphomicrobiaceae bacterium]